MLVEAVLAALVVSSANPATMVEAASETVGMSAARVEAIMEAIGGERAIVRLSEFRGYTEARSAIKRSGL